MPFVRSRAGRGRWAPVSKPVPGVLWTDDTTGLGFVAAPGEDPTPVTTLIATFEASATPATAAFDAIATAISATAVLTGDIDNWRPDTPERRVFH